MLKKWSYGILSAALLSGVLSGCGGGNTAGGNAGSSGTEEKAPSGEPVELTITSSAGTDAPVFEKNVLSYLQKKFPNYKFNYIEKQKGTEIGDLIAAGTPIDLIFETIGGLNGGLIQPGLAMDISELIKKHNIDLNRFEPTLIDGMKAAANGKLYGLPVQNLVMAMYYNKDLFDKFGVSYPKDGMTWDETLELAKKLNRNQDGTQYLGIAVSSTHILRMNPFSLPYVDPKTQKSTFGDERWKTLLNTVFLGESEDQSYRDYMHTIKDKIPYKDEFLKNKNMAMFVYFSDLPVSYPEMDNMNWNVVSAPTFKDLPGIGEQPYPTYWNIAAGSKHPDEAMEVIKYLVSDEFQMMASKRGDLTSLKSEEIRKAYGADYPKKNINWGAFFVNKLAPVSPKSIYDGVAEKPLTDLVNQIASRSIDVNTALSQAEEAANKAIAQEKSK
jgi:multiple sugar transport system substrate-binding protein